MNLIDQALMYNNISRNEDFSTQPQTEKPQPMIMKNIFPLGNGGFGDVSKHPRPQHKQEHLLEDTTAQTQAVVPTRSHPNQNLSYQTGSGKRKMLNNNPWGDGVISGPVFHPLISVPPPSLEQRAWAWAQSSQYPVRYNNDLASFSSQVGNSTTDQRVYESSHWNRHRSGGVAESVCCPFTAGRTSESPTLSASLSPGRKKVAKKRTSGELLRLLDRKEYETDRLKKAEERAQKLAREEEEIEKEKLFKLKTEIKKLEQKRKHQEWQTYQRQERLIRKKEKLNEPVRRRSRSMVRSKSVYPQRRRSRSRSRSSDRSRQKSVAVRSRRNTSRKCSRSRSRVSFRRASFAARNSEQSRSPSRRVLLRRDQDGSSVNEKLLRLAGERETLAEPGSVRYVRYTRTRSPTAQPRREKSRSQHERRNRTERTASRSPRRRRYESSGASTRERTGARERYRSRSSDRRRTRTRSRSQRFR